MENKLNGFTKNEIWKLANFISKWETIKGENVTVLRKAQIIPSQNKWLKIIPSSECHKTSTEAEYLNIINGQSENGVYYNVTGSSIKKIMKHIRNAFCHSSLVCSDDVVIAEDKHPNTDKKRQIVKGNHSAYIKLEKNKFWEVISILTKD